jgi:hypothetical protein
VVPRAAESRMSSGAVVWKTCLWLPLLPIWMTCTRVSPTRKTMNWRPARATADGGRGHWRQCVCLVEDLDGVGVILGAQCMPCPLGLRRASVGHSRSAVVHLIHKWHGPSVFATIRASHTGPSLRTRLQAAFSTRPASLPGEEAKRLSRYRVRHRRNGNAGIHRTVDP